MFIILSSPLRIRDLVLRIVVVGQVLQNAAGFEDIDRLSVGKRISYGGNAAIGVNFKKPWLFLLVFAELELLDFVWEARYGVS